MGLRLIEWDLKCVDKIKCEKIDQLRLVTDLDN